MNHSSSGALEALLLISIGVFFGWILHHITYKNDQYRWWSAGFNAARRKFHLGDEGQASFIKHQSNSRSNAFKAGNVQ